MNLQACSAQCSVSFYACSEALFRQVARVRKAPWAGVHGGLLLACSCSLGTNVLRAPTGKKPAGTYIQGFVDEEGTFWPPGSGRRRFSLSPNMCRPSSKCKFAAARTRARSRAGQRVQAGRALQPALQVVSQLAETVNNQAYAAQTLLKCSASFICSFRLHCSVNSWLSSEIKPSQATKPGQDAISEARQRLYFF